MRDAQALVRTSYHLMWRTIRESFRQPGVEAGNLFIPLFFFFVTVGAVGALLREQIGVESYRTFQLPVAVVQGVAGAAASSGVAVVTDIERGYFDKLLLTPSPRLAIVLGRLAADAVRSMFFVAVILVVGALFGATAEAGPIGYIVVLLMSGLFGAAYSGIGLAIGLRTGNAQAAQAGFLLFFPLLFLSPALAPKELFEGWLEVLATLNPVTYIIEGQRSLLLVGWEADQIFGAFVSVLGFGVLTTAAALWALRTRTA